MSKCPPWVHCHGTGGGGGGGARAGLVALVVIVAAACAGPAERAVSDIVTILFYAMVSLVVMLGVVVLVAWRVHRRRIRAARAVARPVIVTAVRDGEAVSITTARRSALPRSGTSAHLHIDTSPHVVTSRVVRPRCAHRDERRS